MTIWKKKTNRIKVLVKSFIQHINNSNYLFYHICGIKKKKKNITKYSDVYLCLLGTIKIITGNEIKYDILTTIHMTGQWIAFKIQFDIKKTSLQYIQIFIDLEEQKITVCFNTVNKIEDSKS